MRGRACPNQCVGSASGDGPVDLRLSLRDPTDPVDLWSAGVRRVHPRGPSGQVLWTLTWSAEFLPREGVMSGNVWNECGPNRFLVDNAFEALRLATHQGSRRSGSERALGVERVCVCRKRVCL